MREEFFSRPVVGPVFSRRFTIRLDDGWYRVEREPHAYHSYPIDGWRVWWWRIRVNLESIWNGFGTIRW